MEKAIVLAHPIETLPTVRMSHATGLKMAHQTATYAITASQKAIVSIDERATG